jgi:type II secretory pathway pseudopilin PulG
MKKNQSGFSAVESLLILVIVGILAGVGWYVLERNSKQDNLNVKVNSSSQESSSNKLEYLSYDNKLGQKYKLKFYKNYEVTKSPVADSTSSPSQSSENGVGLGSQVSYNGHLPIWLAIASKDLSNSSQTDIEQIENGKKCESNGFSKSFTVHNEFIDQDINVCYVSSRDGYEKAGYLALFTYKNHLHAITIAANKKTGPGQNVATTDLASYDNDLKTIINSVRIIE